jgi:hypothetical protein
MHFPPNSKKKNKQTIKRRKFSSWRRMKFIAIDPLLYAGEKERMKNGGFEAENAEKETLSKEGTNFD